MADFKSQLNEGIRIFAREVDTARANGLSPREMLRMEPPKDLPRFEPPRFEPRPEPPRPDPRPEPPRNDDRPRDDRPRVDWPRHNDRPQDTWRDQDRGRDRSGYQPNYFPSVNDAFKPAPSSTLSTPYTPTSNSPLAPLAPFVTPSERYTPPPKADIPPPSSGFQLPFSSPANTQYEPQKPVAQQPDTRVRIEDVYDYTPEYETRDKGIINSILPSRRKPVMSKDGTPLTREQAEQAGLKPFTGTPAQQNQAQNAGQPYTPPPPPNPINGIKKVYRFFRGNKDASTQDANIADSAGENQATSTQPEKHGIRWKVVGGRCALGMTGLVMSVVAPSAEGLGNLLALVGFGSAAAEVARPSLSGGPAR